MIIRKLVGVQLEEVTQQIGYLIFYLSTYEKLELTIYKHFCIF